MHHRGIAVGLEGRHCGQRHHPDALFTRFISVVASEDAAGMAGGGDTVHDD